MNPQSLLTKITRAVVGATMLAGAVTADLSAQAPSLKSAQQSESGQNSQELTPEEVEIVEKVIGVGMYEKLKGKYRFSVSVNKGAKVGQFYTMWIPQKHFSINKEEMIEHHGEILTSQQRIYELLAAVYNVKKFECIYSEGVASHNAMKYVEDLTLWLFVNITSKKFGQSSVTDNQILDLLENYLNRSVSELDYYYSNGKDIGAVLSRVKMTVESRGMNTDVKERISNLEGKWQILMNAYGEPNRLILGAVEKFSVDFSVRVMCPGEDEAVNKKGFELRSQILRIAEEIKSEDLRINDSALWQRALKFAERYKVATKEEREGSLKVVENELTPQINELLGPIELLRKRRDELIKEFDYVSKETREKILASKLPADNHSIFVYGENHNSFPDRIASETELGVIIAEPR